MTTWHYERQGQRVGPIAESEIQNLIATSVVRTDTLVWTPGMPDWLPLVDSPLASYLWQRDTPPTLPSHTINNGVVWLLALAPILGLMLQSFVAGVLASSAYSAEAEVSQALQSGRFWYLTLLLNIGLSLLDLQRLKAAGVDTRAYGRVVFLVPVYLWKRARSLHQQPITFWVWSAAFVLSLLATL